MKRKKERLKILLIILIALFFVLGISAVAISGYKKHIVAEKEKQEMLEILQKMPKATPTPAATATPTPEPTATPTPTPVITMRATFNPDDYWNTWYSADGLVSLNIYNISNKSVSFSFSQANRADGAHSGVSDPNLIESTMEQTGVDEVTNMEVDASRLWFTSLVSGATVCIDKIVMCIALIVFRIGWWATNQYT